MGMQTDVKVSQPLGSTNTFKAQSGQAIKGTRIKAIYGTSGNAAGTVTMYDGTANTAPCVMTVSTPIDTNQGTFFILIPGEGVLVKNGIYAELNKVDSVMVFYG